MTALKVIGIILLIFILIGLIPIGATAEFSQEGFWLKALAGFIKIQILPKKEKPEGEEEKPKKKKKKKKPKEEEQPPEEGMPEKPKLKVGGMIPMFRELLGLLNGMQKTLRNRLRIKELYLHLTVGGFGSDPAKAAILYGRAWAAVGNVMPQLMKLFRIEKRNVGASVDFLAEKNTIYAKATIVISIGGILRMAVYYGIRALRVYLKHTKTYRREKRRYKRAAKQLARERERLESQTMKGGNEHVTSCQ